MSKDTIVFDDNVLSFNDIDDIIDGLTAIAYAVNETMSTIPEKNYKEQINALFRRIHSFKAFISSFNFEEISSVIEKSEDIMSFLRNNDCTITKDVHTWFSLMEQQLRNWIDEFQLISQEYSPGVNFNQPTFYNTELDNPPAVKVSGYKMARITTHRILILLNNPVHSGMLEKMLDSSFTLINTSDSVDKIVNIIKTSTEPKILITDIKLKDGTIIDIINQKLLGNTELIIYSKLEKNQIEKIKVILKTDHVYDDKSLDVRDLKQIVLNKVSPESDLVHIPFNSTRISLTDLTKSLKAMPGVVEDIKKACFDDNIHFNKLSEIIEQDMVVTGKVLRQINSAYYGVRTPVTSVSRALVLLGKKNIYAITIQGLVDEMMTEIDVSMYGIAYDDIFQINKLRTRLIKAWCRELGLGQDQFETLNTTSLLLALGTMLTAKAIDYNLQAEKFKTLRNPDTPLYVIEKKLLDYSSYDVAFKIFTVWKFPYSFLDIAQKMPCTALHDQYTPKELQAYIITTIHDILRVDGTYRIDSKNLEKLKQNNINPLSLMSAFNSAFGDKVEKEGVFTQLIDFENNGGIE